MKPPKKRAKNGKGRLNLRIPADLDDFIKDYAKDKKTSVTQIVIDHFVSIRERITHVPQC